LARNQIFRLKLLKLLKKNTLSARHANLELFPRSQLIVKVKFASHALSHYDRARMSFEFKNDAVR